VRTPARLPDTEQLQPAASGPTGARVEGDSLLSATRQTGRLKVAGAGALCGIAAMWASTLQFERPAVSVGLALLIGGTAIATVSAFVAIRRIRCPRCGLQLVAHAMKTQAVGSWLDSVITMRACPKCGFGAGVPAE
jgi:ribosomal protein S27AE